jgi:uncharacterized protein
VRDDRDQGRFAVERDGAVAELVYKTEPGRLIIVHTEVPEVLGGRGVGGQLVRAAVARAAAEGLTVVPWCPLRPPVAGRSPGRRWHRDDRLGAAPGAMTATRTSSRPVKNGPMAETCTHLDSVAEVTPSRLGCEDCLRIG